MFPNQEGSDIEISLVDGEPGVSISFTGLKDLEKLTVKLPINKDGSIDLERLKLVSDNMSNSEQAKEALKTLVKKNFKVVQITPGSKDKFISIRKKDIPKSHKDKITVYAERYEKDEEGFLQKHLVVANKTQIAEFGKVINEPITALVPKQKKETKENPVKVQELEKKADLVLYKELVKLMGSKDKFLEVFHTFKKRNSLDNNEFYKIDSLQNLPFGTVLELLTSKSENVSTESLATLKILQFNEAVKAILKEHGGRDGREDVKGSKIIEAYVRMLDVTNSLYEKREKTMPPLALLDSARSVLIYQAEIHGFKDIDPTITGAAGEYASMRAAYEAISEFSKSDKSANLRVIYSNSSQDESAKADYFINSYNEHGNADLKIPVQVKALATRKPTNTFIYAMAKDNSEVTLSELNELYPDDIMYSTEDAEILANRIVEETGINTYSINAIRSVLSKYSYSSVLSKYILLSLVPHGSTATLTSKMLPQADKLFKEQLKNTLEKILFLEK